MSLFKAQVSSSSSFLSFFSVTMHNSSALFWLKHDIFSTKVAHHSSHFQTCNCSHYNSPKSSCPFWNQESVFLPTLHHYLVSETLYDLDKRNPSKKNLSDFRLLAWKLIKFLISFFKPRVSFPLNVASLFSVMTNISYEIF